MSGYTAKITREFEFEDETFEVTFSRLKRKHLMQMLPEITAWQNLKPEVGKGSRTAVIMDLVNKFFEFADEYVHELKGLTDAENKDIPLEVFLEEVYFMDASTKVLTTILEESLGPLGKK